MYFHGAGKGWSLYHTVHHRRPGYLFPGVGNRQMTFMHHCIQEHHRVYLMISKQNRGARKEWTGLLGPCPIEFHLRKQNSKMIRVVLLIAPVHIVAKWSMSNFSSSLTRNITSHSKENLAFHSNTEMKNDYTTNSHYLTYTFSLWKVGRMYFLSAGVKELTRIPLHILTFLAVLL